MIHLIHHDERFLRLRGSALGHTIDGLFYLVIGIATLILIFNRSRNNNLHLCFPEKNPKVVRIMGSSVLLLGIISISIESISGYIATNYVFHFKTHIACGFAFSCVGVSGILESYSLLPEDTMRKFASYAFLMVYLLFGEHAKMQDGSEGKIHQVFANISLATSAAFAYSVYNKEDTMAGIGAYVMVVMNGIWMLNITVLFFDSIFGGHSFRENLPEESLIVPLFVIEFSLLAMLCMIVAAHETRRAKRQYELLSTQ